MNDQDVMSRREQLSALADGELREHDFAQAVRYGATEDGRACWRAYHLIGETLRRDGPLAGQDSEALLARLRERIARDGAPPRPAAVPVGQVAAPLRAPGAAADPAANDEVLRWKLAAGFASLAAVAVLGWNAYVGLGSTAPQGAQIAALPAQSAPAPAPAQSLVATSAGDAAADGQAQVMIRDPRLDELLAAHRQLGNNTSALQMPAGFLRNANFAGRER